MSRSAQSSRRRSAVRRETDSRRTIETRTLGDVQRHVRAGASSLPPLSRARRQKTTGRTSRPPRSRGHRTGATEAKGGAADRYWAERSKTCIMLLCRSGPCSPRALGIPWHRLRFQSHRKTAIARALVFSFQNPRIARQTRSQFSRDPIRYLAIEKWTRTSPTRSKTSGCSPTAR